MYIGLKYIFFMANPVSDGIQHGLNIINKVNKNIENILFGKMVVCACFDED